MATQKLDSAFQKAIVRTANKLLVRGRKVTTQEVRKVYNIKASLLKDRIVMKRASKNNLFAYLAIKGRKLRLILFGAKQTSKGVTVRVKKTEGRKLIRSAFIRARGSKEHVWRRLGKERLPIEPLFTVSPAKMFEKEGERAFRQMVEKEFGPMFKHELDFYLGKLS